MRYTWTILSLTIVTLTANVAFAQHGGSRGGGGHGGTSHGGMGNGGMSHGGFNHGRMNHGGANLGGQIHGGPGHNGGNHGNWNHANGNHKGNHTAHPQGHAHHPTMVHWHPGHRRLIVVGPAVWPGSPEQIVATGAVPATYGVQITQLFAGPAARAGLRPGDTILAVNGYSTPTIDAVREALNGETGDVQVDYLTEAGEQAAISVAAVEGRIGIDGQSVQLN